MFHHTDAPEKIVHTTDQAFFDAIHLNSLKSVQQAVQNNEYDTAFEAFYQHYCTREKPVDPTVAKQNGIDL